MGTRSRNAAPIDKNKGIIYLIQPAELVGTNRFKIGCSCQEGLSRCITGYKKGSRYMYIIECINPYQLEQQLKASFNSKFKLIAGNEYFEGNEIDIDTEFINIVNDYRKSFLISQLETSQNITIQPMNTNQSNNPLNIHSINQTNNIVIKNHYLIDL